MARGSTRAARPRAIATCLTTVASRAVQRHAFRLAQLCARWPEIAGAEVARHCAPAALTGPSGRGAGAVLEIGASSAFAPRLAMIAPELIERVNRFLGAPVVARLRIRHGLAPAAAGPAAPAEPAPGAPAPDAPAPAAPAMAELRTIADPGLREALARLAAGLETSLGAPVFDAARSNR